MILVSVSAPGEELPPDTARPCFPGAGYRKAVSSEDFWTGIQAIVTLPTPNYDPSRIHQANRRYLDNASIYLGGRAGEQEVDAGLSWEVVREPDGSISQTAKAFRPFWRTNKWHSAPARPDLYFYPGDTVFVSVRTTTQPDTLRLDLSLLHRLTEPTTGTLAGKAVWIGVERVNAATAQDAEWTSGNLATAVANPRASFSVVFEAPGFAPGRKQEFKRVNGLDQRGNEGLPAQPTRTSITGAVWRTVDLLRDSGTDTRRLPMIPEQFTDMRCPDPTRVVVQRSGESGERVDLFGIRGQK